MEDTVFAEDAQGAKASAQIDSGRTFRGLWVHSILGEGAMGYAYLASHPVLAAPVVLKTFKAGDASRLLQEARLAARADSPNVVPVLDAGVESGVVFVVQRYIDGIDLEELRSLWRRTGRKLPVDVACGLVTDTARGLHAIHIAGVVHRDIKLENIFLCGDGSAMIGDFGIALDWGNQGHEGVAGTPEFMPPEQWWDGPIDGRVDIYALGVAAHTLLTGEKPFRAESLRALYEAHQKKPYIPPPTSDPSEAYLFAVITRMLRKDASARYSTAGAIVRALGTISGERLEYEDRGEGAYSVGALSLALSVGDLAMTEAAVIVNAANVQMRMNLGVASALRKRGGEIIETQALTHAPCPMGDVVWTTAGALDAQWIAHAVGAIDGAICLARCTLRALIGAEVRSASSIAFPAIGAGVGGVPMALAAKRILEAIRTFAHLRPSRVRTIKIVLFDAAAEEQWRAVLQSMIARQ